VVRAALEAAAAPAQSADIRIAAELEPVSIRIDADPARLQQIIVNLLTNAVKFSSKDGEVRLSAGKSGSNFFIVVSDQGKGIEPHFLPRIFERFSQADSSTTKSHGGLGLGLAIVKQLVDSHGGSIEAASAGKGHGATFKVLLPLSDSGNLDVSNTHLPRLRDFSKITALIVDDDADSRGLTARVLTDVGANVIEASSAQAGIAAINKAPPDILISDIGMANLDGYQLLKTLRESGHSKATLPAIALTAFSRMEDRAQALAAGFQEHLVKPLDPQMLISVVAALCNPGKK
jgi:CheY-like chemotaxis protein